MRRESNKNIEQKTSLILKSNALRASMQFPLEFVCCWRSKAYNYAIFSLLVFLILGCSFLLFESSKHNAYIEIIIGSAAMICVTAICFVKAKSVKLKAAVLLLFFYCFALFFEYHSINLTFSLLIFLVCSVLASTTFGKIGSIISLVLNSVLVLLLVFYQEGFGINDYISNGISFLQLYGILIFVLINAILLLVLNYVIVEVNTNVSKVSLYKDIITEKQKKLDKALVEAKKSDKLMKSFLVNISHETRTPLNVILGFSNLLMSSEVSEEEKQEFSYLIKKNAQSLLGTINDVIDLSKLDSGQMIINNTPTSLYEMVQKAYFHFNPYIEKRNLDIDLRVRTGGIGDDILIFVDKKRLWQVFVNLIGNAIKFTEKGYVEYGYKMQDENEILFFVSDTGIGFSDRKKDQIFERFYKFSSGSEVLKSGIGIGLSLVKDILTLMGGKIWVESKFKEGTTFYFTLPYNPASSVAIQEVEHSYE